MNKQTAYKHFYMLSVVFALCFVVVGFFARTDTAASLNLSVAQMTMASHNSTFTTFAVFTQHLGDWYGYVCIFALLFLLPYSRRKLAIPLGTTLLLSALLNQFVKRVFAISRPTGLHLVTETGYGFPSGHTMNGFVFYILLSYLCYKMLPRGWLGKLVSILSPLVAVFISLCRIYLGVHNTTDVVGGVLLAASVIFFFIALTKHKALLSYIK